MLDIFGVQSPFELKRQNTLPTFIPTESENSTLLVSMIEQIRYERSDGAPMSTRVVVTETPNF